MKKRICLILCLIGCFFLAGCTSNKEEPNINLFYVNPDGNALVQEEYVLLEKNDVEIAVAELIDEMQNPIDIKDFQSAIPQSIVVKEIHLNGERLELSFSEDYKKLGKSAEVLLYERCGIEGTGETGK